MKAAKRLEIDWPSVLGPFANPGSGLSVDELSELDQAVQRYSPRAVRLRPGMAGDALPFGTEPVAWFDRGRLVSESQVRPGAFLQFTAGDYFIQDAGSLLPIALAAIRPGQTVCDVCAAPGGKSTAIAEQLGGKGILVANEVIRSRLSILELALARSGFGNHVILNLECEELVALCGDQFDCVLVDAPCTGQSMVAKGKQSFAAYSLRQIEHSAARQRRIVQSAAKLVRPGGRLVYSTCTFSYAENEGIIQWLSESLADWQPVVDARLSAWAGQIPGTYRLWPHRDPCAGGFAAALIRPQEFGSVQPVGLLSCKFEPPAIPRNHRAWSRAQFSDLDPKPFSAESEPGNWYSRYDGSLHRFSPDIPCSWIEVAVAGVEIARQQTGIWSPSYPSATIDSAILSPSKTVELDDQQAVRFMAGESLRNLVGDQDWAVALWQSRTLGWGKLSHGILKNHLPKQLRQPPS